MYKPLLLVEPDAVAPSYRIHLYSKFPGQLVPEPRPLNCNHLSPILYSGLPARVILILSYAGNRLS